MSIDTLAYAKTLEGAGLDRRAQHILPDLVTKADFATVETDIEQAIGRLNIRSDQAVERLENKLNLEAERAEHRIALRLVGIVGAFAAAPFALLRFVH